MCNALYCDLQATHCHRVHQKIISIGVGHFFKFLKGKLTRNQFLALLSLIVGFVAAGVSLVLEITVRKLQDLIIGFEHQWFLYLVFPAFGILLSVFIVQFFYKGRLEKGVSSVIHDIEHRNSRVGVSKVISNILTSAVTVGFGGSCGLEGPVVAIGSGLGSVMGIRNHLNYRERTLLLACGAAAAISAVFNAPITGLIFAVEILLADILISNILFVMLASAVGMLLSQFSGQKHLLINASSLDLRLTNTDIALLVLLSLVSAGYCLYYVRLNTRIVNMLNGLNFSPYEKALFGGLVLFIVIVFFPLLFGEGYHTVQYLVQNHTRPLFLHSFITLFENPHLNLMLLLVGSLLFKVFATSITIHSGGNGGYFAPSLFVGAVLGYSLAYLINLTGIIQVNVVAFTLVGMAGTLSGIMLAPLTAVFLIAEVTGGYALFVPLMLVSSFTFFFVRHFDPNSIKNRSSVFDSDKADLYKIDTENISLHSDKVLDKQILTIHEHSSIGELISVIKKSNRNLFGVLDDSGTLLGTVHLDDLKDYIFDPEQGHKYKVTNFTKKIVATITTTDSLETILSKFERFDQWYLPLYEGNRYIGFVSKRMVLSELRDILNLRRKQ